MAADISVNLTLASVDQAVTATLSNASQQDVQISGVQIELDRQTYPVVGHLQLAAGEQRSFRVQVKPPSLPGSYLIAGRLHYRNDAQWLTLHNVGIFYVQFRSELPSACQIEPLHLRNYQQRVQLHADPQFAWRLFAPDEVAMTRTPNGTATANYWLATNTPGLVNRYTLYAGAERVEAGIHQASVCGAALTADGKFGDYRRGRIADGWLWSVLLGAAVGVLLLRAASGYRDRLCRYLARWFFIAAAYLTLRHAPDIVEMLYRQLPLGGLRELGEHFWGDAYRYFFEYFADAYFLVYSIAALPYFLLWSEPADKPADKYLALLLSLFSLPRLLLARRPEWNAASKLGLLTIAVKLFFLPYMASWGIQNIRHIADLVRDGTVDFQRGNDFLQTVFMLVDTGIFALGYTFESRRLGSEIKSVDSSFWGWLACLWCYPPFNAFSFRPFDFPLLPIHLVTPQFVQDAASVLVTALWGMFCIASINLGFKASNMTNRGIVRHGLYRYVRHPAYASKLLAWVVQGVVLGQYTLGILLAFGVVYVARALTEERHLAQDPDYLEYQRQVPWRFIPRLI